MKLSPSLLALTSSAFCATTTSAFETQKLLRGATVLASDSKYNKIPADTTVFDRAFIKRGCAAKDVHYMTNADCENKWNTKCAQIGHLPDNVGAWYCGNDDVSGYDPSDFETAYITKGCHTVKWDDGLKAWDCLC